MAKVFVFQTCDKDYTNRLVDRLVTNVKDGYEWIRKEAYPYYNWSFQTTCGEDVEEPSQEMAEYYHILKMIGKDKEGNECCHILIEHRNIY